MGCQLSGTKHNEGEAEVFGEGKLPACRLFQEVRLHPDYPSPLEFLGYQVALEVPKALVQIKNVRKHVTNILRNPQDGL